MDTEEPHPAGRSLSPGTGEPHRSLTELFRELALGDLSALDGIYDLAAGELYGLALWRTGSRADAEDAVQTVFVRLAQARKRLAAVREPRSYLLAMVHRAAVDLRRGPWTRNVPLAEEPVLLQALTPDPARALDARRASEAVRDLPAPQREAIFLHHFGGLTFASIGRVTGVPTFTAASRFRNGIAALRRILRLSP